MKYECGVFSCLKLTLSALIGTILGFFTTLTVNIFLGVMVLSSDFAMYVGILFVAIGILVLSRAKSDKYNDLITKPHRQVYIGSILIILAGSLFFLLDRSTLQKLPYLIKIPIFGYIGVSIELGQLIMIMDTINWIFGHFQRNIDRAIIDGKTQSIYMIAISGFIGAACGVTFGLLDVEDSQGWDFAFLFIEELIITLRLGLMAGFAGGVINEFVRQSGGELKFEKLDNFEEEI
mmetsp:Transcript_3287/g.3619  ORF Transcript_3287/g.3619 Transcript_3287/m.3619 type:complete len:234 (+) Transcript_3287:32-733(+)